MIDLKKEFGKRVRQYRKTMGLSQMKFAEKADITFQTLSSIERGITFPSYPILMKIIETLNVPIVKLFCYDEETVTVKDTEVFNYTVELLEQLDYEKRKLVFKFTISTGNNYNCIFSLVIYCNKSLSCWNIIHYFYILQ